MHNEQTPDTITISTAELDQSAADHHAAKLQADAAEAKLEEVLPALNDLRDLLYRINQNGGMTSDERAQYDSWSNLWDDKIDAYYLELPGDEDDQ